MKRLLSLTLLLLLLCGCQQTAESQPIVTETIAEITVETTAVTTAPPTYETLPPVEYPLPGEVADIDYTLEEPSNDQVWFGYDEEGRVVCCYYPTEDGMYSLTYSYNEETGEIDIFVFLEEELIGCRIMQGWFDESEGFCQKDGVFFRYTSFK